MEELHTGKALIDPNIIIQKIGLSRGMRVADLGCGRTGHFIFAVSKIVGETGLVYAVDIMKDILASIKSRARTEGFDNIQIIWSDIEKPGAMPVPNESLDVCFLINVLFLSQAKDQIIKEAVRLLKPEGKLVIVDWRRKLGPLGPDENHLVLIENLKKISASEGLKLIENFSAGDYHYCLIFKK